MATEVETRRADMMDKVRKLLAKAQSTEFPEEAKALENKAEELMVAYSIAEFELAQSDPSRSSYKPEFRDFDFRTYDAGEFTTTLGSLLQIVARHCGVMAVEWVGGYQQIRLFGYPADLDYVDLLFTTLAMHMVRTINPKWDADLPLGENIANFKDAGYKWDKIWRLCFPEEGAFDRSQGSRLMGPYKKFLKAHPERQHNGSSSLDEYRRQFMDSFTWRLSTRLQELKELHSNEQGLVLVSMHDGLKEALYELRPEMRPHARDCQCSQCISRRSKVPARTRGRGSMRSASFNPVAQNAGRRAADSADLGQTRIQNNKGEVR